MPPSDAQKKASRKFKANKTRQFKIDFSLPEFEEFSEYCARTGEAKTTLIKKLIKERIHGQKENEEI